jgi:hypothetical protein
VSDQLGKGESVKLTLVSAPGHAAPTSVRLRRLLKAALRTYGFRCTYVSLAEATEPDGAERQGGEAGKGE